MALIFNSSGKFAGLQPNRLLRLENGDPYDVVCGTFFLAGLGGETFVSLTPEQLRKYESLYSREMLFPLPKKKEALRFPFAPSPIPKRDPQYDSSPV